MSTLNMNRINRAFVNKMKAKGKKWLEENIAMEKRLSTASEPNYIAYISVMEKALGELEELERESQA